mgnify:CR=1 FL=1
MLTFAMPQSDPAGLSDAQYLALAGADGDGLAALTTWLRERMQSVRQEERTRRLESDADAVALATIHASKGLQYPVVLLPFVADRFVMPSNRLTSLHLHDEQGRRCVDIGVKDDSDRGERVRRHLEEEDGEALRRRLAREVEAMEKLVGDALELVWLDRIEDAIEAALDRPPP